MSSHEANDAWLERRFEELLELGLSPEAAADQAQKELREGTGPNMYATGGRAHFGLGSIIKKIGKTAKKAVSSPLGKAALLGGIGYLANAGTFGPGMKGWWGNMGKTLFGAKPFKYGVPFTDVMQTSAGTKGLLGKWGLTKGGGSMVPTALGWGATALGLGMGATAFEGMSDDEVTELKNNPEALRAYLKQYHSNTHPEKSDAEVDIWVEQNMFSTGGRVGYAGGSGLTFSEDSMEPFKSEFETAWKNYKGNKTKNQFFRIWSRGGIAQGGRIGYAGGADYYTNLYSKYAQDMIKTGTTPMSIEDFIAMIKEQEKEKRAQGGRIGFAFGPDQTAEAAGIMGQLPVKENKAGVKELDLRDSGGFIPPVGVKEKADDIPAMLSNNEFVFTADAVRAAGGGSVEKGAQVMYDQMKNLENRIA
jgi:hypothetical protein